MADAVLTHYDSCEKAGQLTASKYIGVTAVDARQSNNLTEQLCEKHTRLFATDRCAWQLRSY